MRETRVSRRQHLLGACSESVLSSVLPNHLGEALGIALEGRGEGLVSEASAYVPIPRCRVHHAPDLDRKPPKK